MLVLEVHACLADSELSSGMVWDDIRRYVGPGGRVDETRREKVIPQVSMRSGRLSIPHK